MLTFSRTAAITLSSSMFSITSHIMWAISIISASLKPRVVGAGVPTRMPLVTKGDCGSLGTAFLLTVMCALLSAASAALPVMPLANQRNQHQMIVGAAGNDIKAAFDKHFRHGLGVFDHLLLIDAKLRLHGFFKSDGFGGDHVHERAALNAGENVGVDFFLQFRIAFAQNQAAARAAQGFVRGAGDDIGNRHGVRV